MGQFMNREDIKNLAIGIVASTVVALLSWLATQVLGFGLLIDLVFLGIFAGILLGWWLHYQRTLKITRVRIGGYNTDLGVIASSTKIDMLAITFSAFIEFERSVREAICQHDAQVRVLLLNPSSKIFSVFAQKPDERLSSLAGESEDAVRFIEGIIASIQETNNRRDSENKKRVSGKIEYRYFDSIPYRGCIITDTTVRYWPYLHHLHPSNSPTLHIAPDSAIASILDEEFQTIWSHAKQHKGKNLWTVQQIVSGGQTGADRAALDWAIQHKIQHGGWCPKGRQAEDGPIDKRYILKETPSSDAAMRTEWNVRDSDGIVIFSIGPRLTGGTLLTMYCAAKFARPCLHLHKRDSNSDHSVRLLAFLAKYDIQTLNVAGPRASTDPEVATFVTDILEKAFVEATSIIN